MSDTQTRPIKENERADPSALKDLAPLSKPRSRFSEVLRRLFRTRSAVVGLVILVAILFCTVFANFLAPYDPTKAFFADSLTGPSDTHLMGADKIGYDIFSRVLYGGRISLLVGLLSVLFAAVIGVTLGLVAGYYGGWLDTLIMRFTDMLLAFPSILLALVVVAVLGNNLLNLILAVGISAVPSYIRLIRGQVLSTKQNDYVLAARALGVPGGRIVRRHLLPNVLAPIIVTSTLGIASSILAGAGLSFLGLGVQPPTPEWGSMLNAGRNYLDIASWISFFPGLAIMLSVLSINLLGDGLRDALDPRLRV
jgi:peptide/nickel transport system permease protein